jgi:hypothetical protein
MGEKTTSVITVRIDDELNQHIERMRSKLGISKADFIRKYLELSKYIILQNSSVKSLNNRDFIVLKKSFMRKLLGPLDEAQQIEFGLKMARFINDIARLQGEIDNIDYKLDLCENLGFFPKFIDEENYILISKKFGPKKFVEAFLFKIIKHDPKYEYSVRYTEEELESNKSIRQQFKKDIKYAERSASHYSYEFANLLEMEEK